MDDESETWSSDSESEPDDLNSETENRNSDTDCKNTKVDIDIDIVLNAIYPIWPDQIEFSLLETLNSISPANFPADSGNALQVLKRLSIFRLCTAITMNYQIDLEGALTPLLSDKTKADPSICSFLKRIGEYFLHRTTCRTLDICDTEPTCASYEPDVSREEFRSAAAQVDRGHK